MNQMYSSLKWWMGDSRKKKPLFLFVLFLVGMGTFSSHAQTYPGGVTPAAWYRAGATVFSDEGTTPAADNAAVQQWNSQIGAFPLVQTNNARKPVFSNATALANFNPTVTFDGSNDLLEFAAGTGINMIDRASGSIITAGYMDKLKGSGFAGFHATMDYPGLHFFNNYKLLFFTGGPGYQGVSNEAMTAQTYFSAASGWENRTVPAYAAATVSLNGNRVEYGATHQINNANLSTGARDFRIGGDANWGSFSGQLNEVLVYEDKLTAGEMDRVESYLAIKYGTTYAEGTRNYVNSAGNTVWLADATYNNNIAGIARDDNGALYQKQSWSTNSGQQVLIGVGGLENTNAANLGTLADGQYLIWADNGLAKTPTVTISGVAGLSHRFAAVWKVQNNESVGTVTVAWPKGFSNLTLLTSDDETFATGVIPHSMTLTKTINGVEYNYVEVTLSDGQYFTFGAKLAGPGGVTNGLMMWHRADDGTAAGPQDTWRDVSGLGKDVTQNNNTAYRPTLVTKADTSADSKTYHFNFNPFYYFDGSNDFFYRSKQGTYFPSDVSAGSAYGVMFNSNSGGWRTPYGWGDDDPNLARANNNYQVWRNNGNVINENVNAEKINAHIGGMAWKGGSGNNGVYMNIDGQIYSRTNVNIGTITNDVFQIGSEGYDLAGNGNEVFHGGISEVFAYSEDHQNSTGTEKQRINSYLAIKYGITLKNDDGTGVADYMSSNESVVWNATSNDGYNNNIAGIARDDNSALHQKQSHSNQTGQQVLIGTTGMGNINTNAENTVGLSEGQYLVWGDNGGAKSLSTAYASASPLLNLRFGAVWKAQNTGGVGTVRVTWPAGVPSIHLLKSTSPDFTTGVTAHEMDAITTINGVAYNYVDVTLEDGIFFTFAGYVIGPGGVASAAWYRADGAGQQFTDAGTTIAADGETIHQWNEHRGTGYDLLQASAGARPVFSNTTTLANFNPTVTFTGSKWMRWTAGSGVDMIDRADGSIYAAGYWNAVNNADFAGFGGGTEDHPGLHAYGGKLLFYSLGDFDGVSDIDIPSRQYNIIGGGWENEAGITTAQLEANVSLNGIRVVKDNVNNVNTHTNYRDFQVGFANYGSINGQLNEVVVFEQKLSEDEMNRVETYMSIKFGTTYADGTKDYVNSSSNPVWTATTNNGYHHNIAGIARDDEGSLYQKQSWSTNPGKQVLISTIGLANTNAENTAVLNNGQFLIWGDNDSAKAPKVAITGVADVNYRFASIWKVQNTASVGTVRVAWPAGLTNLKLIISDDTSFTSADEIYDMTGSQTVNGVEYAYRDVTLTNGQYFTFAAFVQGPGGVTNNLSHWYRADKLTQSSGDGTDVTMWTDFTSGVEATQLGTTALPKYKAGEATHFNYNPGVNFTADNQGIGNINVQTLSSEDYHFFTVTKNGLSAARRIFSIGLDNESTHNENYDHPGTYCNNVIARRSGTFGLTYNSNPGGVWASNQPSIMLYNLGSDWISKGVNGAPNGTIGTHAVVPPSLGGHMFGTNRVGGSDVGGNDDGFVGHLGEVIIYGNGTITAAERNKVESYLAIKYGITLDTSVSYVTSQDDTIWNKNANVEYYNNVAGIGNDFMSAQHQRQSRSQHVNTNNQIIIGLGEIAETNIANTYDLTDGQFLVWGDNGNTQAMSNVAATFTSFDYAGGTNNARRMNRVWKVQNTGVNQEVLIRFPVASVGTTTLPEADACAAYVIIFADDDAFTTNVSVKPLTLVNEDADYDVMHTFDNGYRYFTYAKVTPYSLGAVYLPQQTEATTEYGTCGVGEFTYFHKQGAAQENLFAIAGGYTAGLATTELTITPQGADYDDGTIITRLMPRITTLEGVNGSSGKVRIYYSEAEMSATNLPSPVTEGWFLYKGNDLDLNEPDEVIVDIFSDGSFDAGKATPITPNATGEENGIAYVEFHNLTIDDVASFVYISSTKPLNEVLPVTWQHFAATKNGNKVDLMWATASEQNNTGFAVERSADGRSWTQIGFVNSQAVNGNSSTQLNYTYADNAPLNGINFYRLKQVDIDGKFSYSPVRQAQFDAASRITIFPNPTSDRVQLNGLKGTETVRVFGFNGKLIYTAKATTTSLPLSLQKYSAGVYLIQVTSPEGKVESFKVVKQ